MIRILRGEDEEDDVFETSRELLFKHSGYMRDFYLENGEDLPSPPSNDCVYDLPGISVEKKYIDHIMKYINTGSYRISDRESKNPEFMKKLEQAYGFFFVDFVPDDVYFLHDPLRARDRLVKDLTPPMIRIYNPEGIDNYIYPRSIVDDDDGRLSRHMEGDYAYSVRINLGGPRGLSDNPERGGPRGPDKYVPRLTKNFSRGKVPNFAYPLQTVGACVIEEYIYVIYGTVKNEIRKPTVARYSTSTKEWEYDLRRTNPYDVGPLSTMPEGGSVVSVGSNIYVISGTSTMVYDTNRLTWSTVDSPPGCDKTLDGALCAFNNNIFLFCGSKEDNRSRSIFKYNTLSKRWIELDCEMPMYPEQNTPSYGHRACLMNGKIYIMGLGETQTTVSCFDPSTTKFRTHSKTIDGTRHGTIFVLNGVLYVTQAQSHTSVAQYYCEESISWKYSKMVDVDGVMSVVMKGGGKLALGDDNWFTLLRASITHDLTAKETRMEDRRRKMEYHEKLGKIDETMLRTNRNALRNVTNWSKVRSYRTQYHNWYQYLWDGMLDVYNRKFYRKVAKIGSKFYKDPSLPNII
jgi:hypothetical protein